MDANLQWWTISYAAKKEFEMATNPKICYPLNQRVIGSLMEHIEDQGSVP